MDTLVVYCSQNSPRLKYVLNWLLKERLQLDYTLTANKNDIAGSRFFIAYGAIFPDGICIPDSRLLWKTGTAPCNVKPGKWQDLPVLFASEEEGYTFPFDLFSALFFLLSRYEEYYPYTPDKHGRYPATSSVLYKQGWLARPVADEWVYAFRKKIQQMSGAAIASMPFLYQPTYDIDIAYSHLHRGPSRIFGAYFKALIKMDLGHISERIQVVKNKQKDPYDSFRWLRQLHKQYELSPIYFILSADKTSAFDKNIHPEHPAMMRVIKNLVKDGETGIHPSYYSDEKDILGKEKKTLEHITARNIHISRQHYIKVKIPNTYRLLLKHHIKADYSMGYGTHLGFRAGTGSSFLWYDLEQETISPLRIYPFCFMDTTAHYEMKLSAQLAFEKLEEMSRQLAQTGSTLITIFHNFSLGTASEWKGWRLAYENFLQEKMRSNPAKEYNL